MWPLILLPVLPLATASSSNNESATKCQDGLILPVWLPQDNLTTGDRIARGMVYFIALMYLFLGVSIISDRFMSAIEVITSQEREVTVKKKGVTNKIVVRVWNETVANLTLMALGSSAPEILLSIIEIYAKNFNAGDLGPGTIVGSAAYNLFVIIAICISVIPDGQSRKIKHLRVFFITATWSVFAYVWLYLILAFFSPGQVDVWEGVVTFMFFPLTVLTAYIADRRIALHKIPFKKFRLKRNRVIVAAESADIEMDKEPDTELLEDDLEQTRKEYAQLLRDLKQQHPNKSIADLELLAKEQIANSGPKSRAFYRIQATRSMTGSVLHPRRTSLTQSIRQTSGSSLDEATRVFFQPNIYSVLENIGTFEVSVVREGRDLNEQLIVEYRTEDGSATAGTDYVGASGTIVFNPGETVQNIKLQVIDDDVFEDEEHFFVQLTDVRSPGTKTSAKLTSPRIAKVLILDDDHAGVFGFPEPTIDVPESEGIYELPVERSSGARGRVKIPYFTEDGTAKAGKDYVAARGYVVFENNESRSVSELFCVN